MVTETLRPNASGDRTECDVYPTGTANWDCVDEETSDGNSTYVKSTLDFVERQDLYNLPASSIPAGSTINSVTVYIVARGTSVTYQTEGHTKLKTNGVEADGTLNLLTTTYTTYSSGYGSNPVTGLPWTVDEINALQIGVSLISSSNLVYYVGRCTQVYVVIDYTPPAVGVACKRLLVGVGL